MLISFGVQNFRSFGARQEFTFLASKDTTAEDRIMERGDLRVSRVSALFGANASGKSNLLNALGAARRFVADSATKLNQGDEIAEMVPNRLVEACHDEPCRFDFSVLLGPDRYEYAFACDAARVVEESLYVKPLGGKRAKRLFTRTFNATKNQTVWELGSLGSRDRNLIESHTRDNGLALSRAAEFNIEPFGTVYRWFKEKVRLIDNAGLSFKFSFDTVTAVRKPSALRDRVIEFLRAADFGIADVLVQDRDFKVPDSAPPEFRDFFSKLSKKVDGGLKQSVVKTVRRTDTGKPILFEMESDESTGTARWFSLLGFLLRAVDQGWLVSIDELDCSLHPLLTEKIVGLFNNPSINKAGAQLVFTTHDTTLLRPDLLRRDQVWLVERTTGQQSELFSLYDIVGENKPRKQENWAREYLQGVYGGVPLLGHQLESVLES
jgi:uncharacterized protein